jgi:thiol-disulfide isomerase/thioredoxin
MIEALLAILVLLVVFYFYKKNSSTFDMPTVTFYYTTWCPWCKKMNPIWAAAKRDLSPRIVFVENDQTHTKDANIDGYPTILLSKGGRVYKYKNVYDVNSLKKWIIGHLDYA